MADPLQAVLLLRDAADYIAIGTLSVDGDRLVVRACLEAAAARNLQQPELLRLCVMLGAEALPPRHPSHAYFVERHRLARRALTEPLARKEDPATASLEVLAF